MSIDLTARIKELVRLAREQGFLTYEDINHALPDDIVCCEDLDDVYIKLRNLGIEIVDRAAGTAVSGNSHPRHSG